MQSRSASPGRRRAQTGKQTRTQEPFEVRPKHEAPKRLYVKVYFDCLNCRFVTSDEKIIFICFKSFMDFESDKNDCAEGTVYPSIATIAAMLGWSRQRVGRVVRSLEQKKIITRRRRGQNKTNVYEIADYPEMWTADSIEEMMEAAEQPPEVRAARRLTDQELLAELERRGLVGAVETGNQCIKKGLSTFADVESPGSRMEVQDSTHRTTFTNNNITPQVAAQVGKVDEISLINTKKVDMDVYDGCFVENEPAETPDMDVYDGCFSEPEPEPAGTDQAAGTARNGPQAAPDGGIIYTDDLVKDMLGYYDRIDQYEDVRDLIDDAIPVIRRTLNSKKPYFSIAGEEVPAEVVKAVFSKLDLDAAAWAVEHVEKQSYTTEIKNRDAYTRTALYDSGRNYRQRCRNHANYYVMGDGQGKIAPPL